MSNTRAILITMGDPAGIGPEIICKAIAEQDAASRERISVIGTLAALERANKITGSNLRFAPMRGAGVVHVENVELDAPLPEIGRVAARAGDLAYRYVARGVELALAGGGCIVTAPINKEALNKAGHHYDGHTGMIAALTGAPSSFMLLTSDLFSVIHVSTHVALETAIARVKSERVLDTIFAGEAFFRRIGVARPRLAVAGLNPHCGEHGLFGNQEAEFITPAIARARERGIDVAGPISPDTVFHRAMRGEFDLVVAQYHDQGHIPIKLVAFDTTVNVSLGLPIDRTSVDHGTAFDIAGTGRASHRNLMAAIAYARRLANAPRPA